MSILVTLTDSSRGKIISEVNQAIESFLLSVRDTNTLAEQVEVALLESREYVTVHSPLKPINQTIFPLFSASSEHRALGQGLDVAINMLRTAVAESKQKGHTCRRPWCVVITDGQASDVWEDTAARLKAWSEDRSIIPVIINVGDKEDGLDEYSCIPTCHASGEQLKEILDWVKQSIALVACANPGDTVRLLSPPQFDVQTI
ncbi:vWA domain-containing protein [Vibrio maerlii]|uniref:vWA domain-containing protein n=1 Tax=Vibrio maerlii TaxID=2231648 RepID=UPI000F4DC71F|nr:hypothetical protein [Vibrio maerlii]